MKKLIIALCVGLCSVLNIYADASISGFCGQNLRWNYNAETRALTITGSGDMSNYGNNAPWRQYRSNILSVSLPQNLTSIGEFAFVGCTSLTSITIPNSVTSIGDYAFDGCTGLTSVTIGNSVTSIGDNAFNGCISLTSITIPNSVTSIEYSTFKGCTGLTSVTIGNGVTSIGSSAFHSCTGLTSITIPNSVTNIGEHAFYGCTGLTSVTIGNGVTSIGSSAFLGCINLTQTNTGDIANWCAISFGDYSANPIYYSHNLYINGAEITDLIIPDGVTSIGNYAFHSCTGLTSVAIPNSVTSIGALVFVDCTLTSITIPNSVTSIGFLAFYGGVINVEYYGYATGAPWGAKSVNGCVDGWLVYKDATKTNLLGCSSAATGSVTIPNSVTSIGDYAFQGCTGLTSVTVPNSVTSIESGTFQSCTGLTSVTIGNGVTSIGDYAFDGCTSLTSVSIPNSVTNIGEHAFYGCTGLTSVTIGNGVTSIGSSAFFGCTGLTSVTIGNGVTSIGSSAFFGCTSLKKVNYTGDVKGWVSISMDTNPIVYSKNLYLNDVLLTDLVLPEGITTMSNAFAYDTCLTSITIPNSVTSIGKGAFSGCTGLTSVIIPNSVMSIERSAFSGCTGLTSVTIGNSVTSIGYAAFYNCTGLSSVVWNAKAMPDCINAYDTPFCYGNRFDLRDQIKSFTFGDEVDSIPDYLCSGMRNLASISIGNNVVSIGVHTFSKIYVDTVNWNTKWIPKSNCFPNDANIRCFTFGNEVDSIPDKWCENMKNLQSVTIGNGVRHIGDAVFRGCTALSSVVWNAKKCVAVPFYSKKITSFTFGDKVESIPDGLCSGMEKLTSITIPNSVTSIGSSAFRSCTGLKKVNYTGDVKSWVSISMESNPIVYSKNLYLNDVLLTDLILPEGITTMSNAFAYDTCLTSVTIPNSVTSIEGGAFCGCSGLTSVIIPNSVMSIERSAFSGCTGLTSITIPNSVTSIGDWAFHGCGGLTSIVVESGNPVYDNRNNCNAIIVTSTNTLMLGCNTTVIPKSVTSIGVFAFKGCSSLTSITIPESVTSIGNLAFEGCTGLESINVRAERPPFIYSDTFKDIPTYIPVYIPCGTKETYQLAREWQKFTNFIESLGITLTLTSQDTQMGSVRFTKKGASCTENESVFEAIANEGYIFTQWSDGNTDNPRHLVLTQDTIIVAQFRGIRSYAVNVDCNPEQGSVSGSGVYTETAPVTLTATANTGYRFSQWSDGNTDNPRTLTLTSDTTLTAEFVVASFMVTATALHGSVTGTGYYSYGDEAVLTVNTEVGYRFTQWGDGNTDNPRTIIVIQDTSLTAQCEAVNHTITVTCNPQQGNVIGGGTYADGAQVTLAAIANKGYEFAQWSNGVTDNPYLLTATADLTLEAQFVPATAVDNVSADGTTSQKIVRDGQVYILRNGKTYTTTGVEVK